MTKISELVSTDPLPSPLTTGDFIEVSRETSPGVYQSFGAAFSDFPSGISGSLTTNRIPVATGVAAISDSYLIQNGTGVLIDSGMWLYGSDGAAGILLDTVGRITIASDNSGLSESFATFTSSALNLGFGASNSLHFDSTQAEWNGPLVFNPATASRVAVFGSSKELTFSSVTTATLAFLDATSSVQTQLNGKQPLATNLTSLSGLTYASASFVKMTAAGTFALDTNTYLTGSSLIPIAQGGTNATSQTTNGVAFFNGTIITTGTQFKFDGTNVGIGAVPDSLLTVSKQTTIIAPPTDTSVHFVGEDAKSLRVVLDTHNNAGAGGTAFIGRRSRGTASSPLAAQSGDTIISFNATPYGTTGFAPASTGLATFKLNQLATDAFMGTYFTVFTTPDNSITAAESLRVTGDGAINASQSGGVFQINGSNVLTSSTLTLSGNNFTLGGATSITGGGTLALGGFTLTVPATGTVVLGSGVATQIPVFSGTNTIGGSNSLLYSSPILTNSVSNAGATTITCINSSNGLASTARIIADNATVSMSMIVNSTGFTTSGLNVANLARLQTTSTIGLMLNANTSSTTIWMNVGGTAASNTVMSLTTGSVTLADVTNIVLGSTTGTKIGTSATQKLGFFNVTPVIQRGAITSPSGGAIIDTEARTAIDAIRQVLIDLGLTA